MAEVQLDIGGRAYRLICRDGEEPALKAAAAYLDSKSRELTSTLGALSEARLLLMSALIVAGELLDRDAKPMAARDEIPSADVDLLVARVEALANRLENAAANT